MATREEIEALDRKTYVMLWTSADQKNSRCWTTVDEDGRVDDSSWFTFKNRAKTPVRTARPGSMWTIPTTKEGSVYLGYAEYAGQFDDQDRVARWWARHRANELYWKMQSDKSKAMNNDLLHAQLDPVKETYMNLRAAERRALLAYVIEYITRP